MASLRRPSFSALLTRTLMTVSSDEIPAMLVSCSMFVRGAAAWCWGLREAKRRAGPGGPGVLPWQAEPDSVRSDSAECDGRPLTPSVAMCDKGQPVPSFTRKLLHSQTKSEYSYYF